jgi:uncharacterized protein (TIGR03066 family)
MRLLLINLSLLACLLGLSTVVVPISAAPIPKGEPKRPKTMAEKLVGKWKSVKMSGHPTDPAVKLTMEYTKDGKLLIESDEPKYGHRKEQGTYTLVGQTIRMAVKTRSPNYQHWSLTIVKITHDKLVVLISGNKPGEEGEFRRIEAANHN